jgi:2-keto-3-deoxy-L-rhamnonate aldolase RhmA
MISPNRVLHKLREKEAVFGPLINFSSPWFVDIVGATGFDFVLLDAEHGLLSLESTEHMIRAAEGVESIDAIAATDGVDIVAIGPGDLSASLGFRGDGSASAVREAVEHVIERAHAHGRWVSPPAADIDSAACW